ncbi:MAG TPA: branched-chain amino acid ABC transporter permease [Euzebyales bacterium]|nr:branched-chain amino acid ABC transporter permease [Euzebyales bacterium]
MSRTRIVKVGALVVAVAIGLAVPYVAGSYIVSILTLGLIYALYAMSIDLMGGYGGLVTLGQGGILAAGSYGVGYVAARMGGGFGQQLLWALLATLLISALFGIMAMRTSQVYFLMVTLAQGMIVWGFVTRSTVLGAENGLRGIERPPMVSAYWKYYYLCLAVVVTSGLVMALITRSPLGLSLRALKDSETRMRMLGYSLSLTKFYVFMLSGLFAGIAGTLLAYYTKFVSPANAAFAISGRGVLMAILGGIGTLFGPVIGAFIIVLTENILSIYFARWTTVLGLIFILTIMFAPDGLVGAGRSMIARWRGRPDDRPAGGPLGAGPLIGSGRQAPGTTGGGGDGSTAPDAARVPDPAGDDQRGVDT